MLSGPDAVLEVEVHLRNVHRSLYFCDRAYVRQGREFPVCVCTDDWRVCGLGRGPSGECEELK